jgi:hypothetical protein
MLAKNLKSLFSVTRASPSLTAFPLRSASQFISTPSNFDLQALALQKQSEELLIEQPWTTKPFLTSAAAPLSLPVFNFASGAFTGQVAQLDEKIYNLPLRRDIVHIVHMYFQNLNKKTYKRALTRGDVAGSGKKMRPQKKSGRAR